MDLSTASRDDLLRRMLAQREAIARLEQVGADQQAQLATRQATIRRLTERVGDQVLAPPAPTAPSSAGAAGPGVPGTTPTSVPPRPKKPRTRRAHGFGRRRMEPTARQVRRQQRQDASVQGWAEAVDDVSLRARQDPATTPAARQAAKRAYAREVLARCQP